ncbi:hypothetical protein BCV72DRAFT_267696, partial [Rhizopus microsporus var. microsporus]
MSTEATAISLKIPFVHARHNHKQLEEAHSSVQRMKQKHDDSVISRIMDSANTEINSLKAWIDSKVKKLMKHTEYGLLLPVEKDENKERFHF